MHTPIVNTRRLATCGLLIAVSVVFGGMLKIPLNLFGAYSLKLSFSMIPIFIAAVKYGPVYGGICGGAADFIQAILFPVGAYNPLFTLTGIVLGMVPGLFFAHGEEPTFKRLACAITTGQIIGSVLLNTTFQVISYGLPWAIIGPRALNQAIFIPIYTVITYILVQKIPNLRLR